MSKIDGSKYSVSASKSNGVPILRCTAKSNVFPTTLKYGNDVIWKGNDGTTCKSALIYFDGNKPKAAVLGYELDGRSSDMFLYKDTYNWVEDYDMYKETVDNLVEAAEGREEDDDDEEEKEEERVYDDEDTMDLELDDGWDEPTSQEQEDEDEDPEPERRPRKSRKSRRRKSKTRKSRGSNEKLPEDEDSEFQDDFWDTPDDYSERQDDTQDEPDELVIEEDEAVQLTKSSGSPVSIDIAQPSSACRRFEYIYEDNHVRLLIPHDGVPVVRMFDGKTILWEMTSNQTFEFSKIYLNKYRKPELVLIATTTNSVELYTRFKKTWKGWKKCEDYSNELDKLKITSEANTAFTIHLEDKKDTEECTIFEARMINFYTQFFFPKPGYFAREVMYNGVTLWKSTNGNERCIGCDLYLKGRGPPLLVVVIQGRVKGYKFFELVGSRWVPVKDGEFPEKLERMKIANGKPLKDFDETIEPEEQDMNVQEPPEEEETDYHLDNEDKDEKSEKDYEDVEETEEEDNELDENEEEDEPPSQEVNVTRNYSRSTGGSSDRVDTSPSATNKLPNSQRGVKRQAAKDKEIKDQPFEVSNGATRRKAKTPTIHRETKETSGAQRVPANHVNNNVHMQQNINCRETTNYNKDQNIQPKHSKVNNSQRSDKHRNTDNLESESGLTDAAGALRGGSQYTVNDTNTIDTSREIESEEETHYTDFRDLFDTQSYSETKHTGEFSVDMSDSCISDPTKWILPKKGYKEVNPMRKMITPLFFPTFQSDTVINVSKYHPSFYNLYDYYFDDVITRLIIPEQDVTMTKLTNGRSVIWNAGEGESLVYATIHLKANRPVLVYILKDCTSKNKIDTLLRTNKGWKHITNYVAVLKSIPRPKIPRFDFTMDLIRSDNARFKVFDAMLGGIRTRFFIPRRGFRADKVHHNGAVIWKAQNYKRKKARFNWRAILVRAYLKRNSCYLIKITLRAHDGALSSVNYINSFDRWVEIDGSESERSRWILRNNTDFYE
ncbi:hypothetical protein BEWA_054400 [Theileria equi strain WA]|uniref:Uncharacterized protein n=1 Tax=Theileria equi strain WA TaxID=1537102 RepID=L1LDN2_THEEQ|nr:hypothetical protein BEWA_054400 [Theileria equi strain WA]EKX73384.1 hypothetical protein BEWA_054400 [Theileria equi strain WA]|eukprot:XP_004832836.1 hypothetical protein BEWA_054400 [Theileria equi strain WA]